jgi:hypothetical protein
MDSLVASFNLNGKHSNIIDQWISYAIARGVERINLTMFPSTSIFWLIFAKNVVAWFNWLLGK